MRKRNVQNYRKSNKQNTIVEHVNIDEKIRKGDCEISPIIESLNEPKSNNIVSITDINDNPFNVEQEEEQQEDQELSIIKIDLATPSVVNDDREIEEYDREIDEYVLIDKIIDDLGDKINAIDKERFVEGFIRKLLLNAF